MSTTVVSLDPRPRRSWSTKSKRIATGVLASLGFFLIIAFAIRAGDASRILNVAALAPAIGWVIAIHITVIACDSAAWRSLVGRGGGARLDFLWARWVREATNLLLPVAQIGGEVAGARVLAIRGTAARLAGASVVLDKLSEALSQVPFTLLGLALMLRLSVRTQITEIVWLALAAGVAALGAMLLMRRAQGYHVPRRRLAQWLASKPWPWLKSIEHFLRTVRAIYRPRRVGLAIFWHFLAWLISTGEVWLALRFLGHPVSLAAAIALESLSQAIIGMGFVVPAGLGVQEGAYIVIGATLGLPIEAALALSLVKRMRQLALGLPALLSWQVLELRRLLGMSLAGSPLAPVPPSSNSNSYVRRFVRLLLAPLAGTSLEPNTITWLRIASGVAASLACCAGQALWNHWAALLWLVSAVLDRGDGEFARLTGRCSERGRRLDYRGDVAVNSLIFLAVGINLQHRALGHWSILIGAGAMAAVAAASILAETLERRIGEKTVPSRYGFDADDLVFTLVPILWFGHLLPLLIGALLGGMGASLYIFRRLARLITPRGTAPAGFGEPAPAVLDASSLL